MQTFRQAYTEKSRAYPSTNFTSHGIMCLYFPQIGFFPRISLQETHYRVYDTAVKREKEWHNVQSFFVSSTFKDMQGERDALHRTVMPRLREQAAKNGENIQFVDLRWGISTADTDSAESTSKILSVCLREVQNCKPYMIVLLGQRYGWIPPVDQIREAGAQMNFIPHNLNISVTELEIRFGLYMAEGQLDRCIFCLREPMDEASLTPEQKEIYLSSNNEDTRRMGILRQKILNTPGAHVITYRLESNNGNLTGYDEFSEKLYSVLEQILSPRWAARKSLSWQQRQREEDAIISENHLRNFVERKDTLQQVIDAIRYSHVVMLEGEGGCGKSALMAKLDQTYRKHNYHSIVLFCGTSSSCMTVKQLMRLMLWHLETIQGKALPEVADDRLQEHFQEQMKHYTGPTCFFFLDAIDQLAPDQDLFESRFLPPEMSTSIRLILSTTGAVRVNPAALTGFRFHKIQLEPPKETELRTILHSLFAAEHKQVSQKVADKILENPCSKNMLGMEIIARRLVMLGKKDFAEISRLEQTMSGAEAIDTYLLQLLEKLPGNLNNLIIDYFFDVSRFLEDEEDYARTAMQLYLIGIMQHGITPGELEDFSHMLHTAQVFSNIPADHPWLHFWSPISFARLKRFMGGLLVERSNGNIDYSHRLLRQALRSADTFSIIAPVLRCWLIQQPDGSDQKLENILPVSRLAEMDNRLRYPNWDRAMQADLIDSYFSAPIRHAGNLENDNDPEGTRQLAVLERSVIQDITGEDQNTVAASYCDTLSFLIQDGASADHYTIWFFGSRIATSLSRLGQPEKACALRLLCCILSNLHKQKEAFEAGETRFAENWTTKRKRRFLFFHCQTLQMMADLMMDFRLGNVDVKYFDGMKPDVIFQKGCALADECIREDPTYGIFHLRKAVLYAAYAKQTSDGANFGFTKGKQLMYTQEAFRCIQQAFQLETTDFFREYALHIIAICMEAIHMDGRGRLFGSKKTLDFGIEMCRRTWELVTSSGDIQKLPIDCVARFKLAWSRCLDARGDVLTCRDSKVWQQQSLDLCAEYYLQVRSDTERVLNQADRKYLGAVGAQACLMMIYGNSAKAMTDAGYSRPQAIRYITNKESGYFRAEARRDFTSRWHWAIMLCSEGNASALKPGAGLETMDQAITILEDLRKAADEKGYALDISLSRIEAILGVAKRVRDKYAQQANQK